MKTAIRELLIADALQEFVNAEEPELIAKLEAGLNINFCGKSFTPAEFATTCQKIGEVCQQALGNQESLIDAEYHDALQKHVLANLPDDKFPQMFI